MYIYIYIYIYIWNCIVSNNLINKIRENKKLLPHIYKTYVIRKRYGTKIEIWEIPEGWKQDTTLLYISI